jgi:hypothetical protein
MSRKIDNTKDSIGVSGMNDREKKEMFEKFIDAGGEVVRDRRNASKEGASKRSIERRTQGSSTTSQQGSSSGSAAQKKKKPVSSIPAKPAKTQAPPGSSFFDKLLIKFKLLFLRVTNFGGTYFHKNFLKAMLDRYNPALMELQIIYFDLLRNNPSWRKELIEAIDSINPLYTELIEFCGNIYDKMKMDELTNHYRNFPDMPLPATELKGNLMDLYKKLYILYPYQNMISFAYERAVDQVIEITGKKTSRIVALKRRARSELTEIFTNLFPRLHLLFCLYEDTFFEVENASIARILQITEDEKPGKRKKGVSPHQQVIDEVKEDEAETKNKEEEKEELQESIKEGLRVMYNLDLKAIRKLYDKNNIYDMIPENDKVLMTYLYFKEFDEEYSTILTNSTIKYRIDYGTSGKKEDYQLKLNQKYDEMRTCYQSFDMYADVYREYEKIRRLRPSSNEQYMQYSKKLEELKKKLNSQGRVTRQTILDYIVKLNGILEELNEDINSTQKFIENPQDMLEFNIHIEGMKKLNKKKVYDAFAIVLNYTSAFIHRLGPSGDLGGATLVDSQEEPEEESSVPSQSSGDEGDDLKDLI